MIEFTVEPRNLYLVLMNSADGGECFYKIGVTSKNSIEERFDFGTVEVTRSGMSLRGMLEHRGKSKYVTDHPYEYKSICFVRYGVTCGRGRKVALRLWPTIFSGQNDVLPA